jgi:hypothetical protein
MPNTARSLSANSVYQPTGSSSGSRLESVALRWERDLLIPCHAGPGHQAAAGTSGRDLHRSVAEAAQSGPRQRRAWAQLIDHLIAGERDAEQEELRGLIAYCHERVDLLNSRDADFIVSMKRIGARGALT